jgi:hypothetical protein
MSHSATWQNSDWPIRSISHSLRPSSVRNFGLKHQNDQSWRDLHEKSLKMTRPDRQEGGVISKALPIHEQQGFVFALSSGV